MFGIEKSSRCSVSEHSSTESEHRDLVGEGAQLVARRGAIPGGARRAAEPEQRRALHVRPSPSRLTRRASMDGVAMPVR